MINTANLPATRCGCGGEQDVRECHVTHPSQSLDLSATPTDYCAPCRKALLDRGLLVLTTRKR